MDPDTAYRRTVEVDTAGLSVVAITHRERAELLEDQLRSRMLTVSIEQA